jgi:zinc transport system substrate-binding protein
MIPALLFVGCGQPQNVPGNSSTLKIITSFYPIYEIVKQVGGANVTIQNLVPAGAEPHDYEPTPQEIVNLNQADLVVYNGMGLEPWADKIIPELQQNGSKTLNLSDYFKNNAITNSPKTPGDAEYLPFDPHLWLDPVNYQKEVQTVTQKLVEIDPNHQTDYQQNSQKFIKQLQELDLAYQNGFKSCKLNSFVTSHAAFAYLANRYHLKMVAISGLSPDAEPSSKVMAELTNLIRQNNIQYILTESLVSPKIADTLAQETGTKTLILNPLEGLTDQEIAKGKNYVSVMQDNLRSLQTALECGN